MSARTKPKRIQKPPKPKTRRILTGQSQNCKLEIVCSIEKDSDDAAEEEKISPMSDENFITLRSLTKEIHDIESRKLKRESKARNFRGPTAPYMEYREENLRFWRKRGFWYNDTLSLAHYCTQIADWMVDDLIGDIANEILDAIQLYGPLTDEFKGY